jgi:CBS domain-containing protein
MSETQPAAATSYRPNLHSPLAALARKKPITATPETPLREAVLAMAENRVGSIIVVEPESGRPLGIFTLRDLLHRVAAKSCDLDQMVMSVMSDSGLLMLNWRSTIYQAALVMARHGVHHVIIVDAAGKLAGIVSQEDIYELQSGGGKAISGAIRTARDMNALVAAAEGIRRLAIGMLAEGAAAEQLTQLISNLNDHLTVRIIELTRSEFELPRVEWCWLAFGSEGRFEQTLSTDQDNGLVFAAPEEEAAAVRDAFLPFARAVNERLAQCGFPLCEGNVMAGNPELCLSVYECRANSVAGCAPTARRRCSTPRSIRFRPIYGQEELADQLREWVLKRVPSETLFLRFMAGNAVQIEPPIGFIREFTFDKNPDFPHTLDLKASGARLFVDAARILALANGVTDTGTVQRLRALAARGKLGGDDVNAVIEGFFFIQQLRLKNQQGDVGVGAANRVDPDHLNELDRLVLREAFKQAKRLQSRLQLEYRL